MQHLLRPLEVENLIATRCPIKPHKHSFFELVYILDGVGTCIIDNCQYHYSKDHLFVIVPENGHHTIVQETTSFVFIRFNSRFLSKDAQTRFDDTDGSWVDKLDYIFANQQRLQDGLDADTRALLRPLCKSIVREASEEQGPDSGLLHQLIRTMLMLIVKRIESRTAPKTLPEKSSVRTIVDYIHENIKVPDNLRIGRIAEHVNMSTNYVSEYFRKFYPKSLRQYIIDYRFELIAERLRRSDLRLSEIAFEFGFSGESHLASAFRKHQGVSPMRFRKKMTKPGSVVVGHTDRTFFRKPPCQAL